MRDGTWHWARRREKTCTGHKTGPLRLPWHMGLTRAATGDRGPGGAPYSPAERNFWPPHGAARSASMARWRWAPLARPDDAPAVPPRNDPNSPGATGIYENTGRERTPKPPITVHKFVVIGGLFRQCTVQNIWKSRRRPWLLCTILSLSGAYFGSALCTLRLFEKKKVKTENTPIK